MKDGRVAVVVGPRPYPYKGVTYPVGHVMHVTAATADRMENAKPPYGRRIDEGDPWASFSDTARSTLENAGVGPLDYTGGRQDDGRVHVSDVRDWLAAREAQNG